MMLTQLNEQDREELVSLRRHFHAHPELSLEEKETADFIEKRLRALGLSPVRVGEHGLCATVYANHPGCKTVAIRAEMDALAVEERSDFPWRSQNPGVMHACGHDGILACVLELAKLCAENQDTLPVNVKFLFQSAEENGQGTFLMLDSGAMDEVDYFIMLHFVNDAPSGVELHRGASSATIGSVRMIIHGRASHWCTSELGVDSINAAGNVLEIIEEINRTYKSDNPFILGIGTISGGTAKNIVAENTTMEGTLRACRKEDYFNLRALLLERLAEVERECGVTIDAFVEDHPIPPLWNDDSLVDLGLNVGRPLWGKDCRLVTTQYLSGDSASYYFEHARGIFFVFTAEKTGEENFPLHNGRFDFDEAVMEKAVIYLFDYIKSMSELDKE